MNRPVVVDSSARGDAPREGRPKVRGRDGTTAGSHAGLSVVIEGDGLIVERFRDPRRPVWLFGAGHVGRALMLALAPLPFDVAWIDERADAFPAAMPANVRSVHSADPTGEVARAPDGALIVVMTHSHARDLAVVHAALAAGRFGYVGLIGSASKRARFTRRLRQAGVPEACIAKLVCPIGPAYDRFEAPRRDRGRRRSAAPRARRSPRRMGGADARRRGRSGAVNTSEAGIRMSRMGLPRPARDGADTGRTVFAVSALGAASGAS